MSTAPPPAPAQAPPRQKEITIYSHSSLFYWWPVWVGGFIMAIVTAFSGERLALVPAGTIAYPHQEIPWLKTDKDKAKNEETARRDVLVAPQKHDFPRDKSTNDLIQPRLHIAHSKNVGVLFCTILLLVIFITNVPLRGLWSFLSIMGVVVIALLFSVFHVWDDFYTLLGGLHVFINMAGYMFVALAIFALWVVAVYIFDRRTYIIFTPGQVKVCEHIGASVRTYDTVGLTFEKQRDDLFRHIILGFGSGDLIVRTAGAERTEIKIQNVLMIGSKLKDVENLLRERAVA